MKVVAITGQQQCQLVDKPDLKATDDFVVVKVLAAPMCTEYKMYKSGPAPAGLTTVWAMRRQAKWLKWVGPANIGSATKSWPCRSTPAGGVRCAWPATTSTA